MAKYGTISWMKNKRFMLKLSGELFAREGGFGLNHDSLTEVAKSIKEVADTGAEVVVVVGGGNIWRFRDTQDSGIERTSSDAIGMLATIMNAVGLQSALETLGQDTRVCSAIDVPQLAEPYIRRRAMRHLEKGRVIICAGGTGNPYFTTDSAAALRASELQCDVLLKATNVDGVYDKDPNKHDDAVKYEEISYQDCISQHLNVMDQAAFSLCMDQNLPICVFKFDTTGSLLKAAKGEKIGTVVHN
jgi:uridylate kinase